MLGRFNSNKFKTQCKLCISRIKLNRNKRQLMLKQTRKEVADLLRSNKQGNARIRVETVIREAYLLQAYDILELFLELLAVRVPLLEKNKRMPADMVEGLASIVYAAARINDFPELTVIRGLLGSKYGKEFVAEAGSDENCRKWHVNENLLRCLCVEAPPPDEKLQTLSEIAQEFGVEWDALAAARDMLPAGEAVAAAAAVSGGGNGGMSAGENLEMSSPGDNGNNSYGGGGNGGGGGNPSWGGGGAPGGGGAAPRPFAVPPGGAGGGPGLVQHSDSGEIRAALFGSSAAPPILPSSGPGGASHGGGGPQQPPAHAGDFVDANAAAAAARGYSEQARHAAEEAERLARGGSGGSGSGGDGGGTAQGFPLIKPASAGGGGYVNRSQSSIQRDYDSVPTPAKPPSLQPGAASAPPPPAGMANGGGGGAPADAAAGSSSGTGTGPGGELDELAKRFEMLKRR